MTDRALPLSKKKRIRTKCNVVSYHLGNTFLISIISFKTKNQESIYSSDTQKLKI